ncbi:MAG: GNAT family N-acetyltransferase, partial [Prevotellaceae bacterium]|nr:GNAT family N-acetyltransferase [Prevotellaceae bacterium]
EHWLNEVDQREGKYNFLKHFIVYHHDRKIGYCLHADCFFLKYLEENAYDVSFWNNLYAETPQENHTYEIGYLIGEEEFLNKGIGKIIVQLLEEKVVEIGGKEMSSDPDEENIISIKTLLSNGFTKKGDSDYRKTIAKCSH